MPTLSPELRNKLEGATIAARDISEIASRAALETLAVHHHEPFPHMPPEQRMLRNKLRAHARQVGDKRFEKPDKNGADQEITHLVEECAYEHWHQMLFARFLAENNLLMLSEEGEKPVPISLDDCKELAKEAKTDLWTLAGRCSQKMLPKIFRPDDPLLQVTLAREHQIQLERELDKLSTAIFTAIDSLGWCYQFWQAERKDAINASGKKIGADELAAVTQLFTEDYMVDFLLHNTLGAWWARRIAQVSSSKLRVSDCPTEEEARKAVALPAKEGVPAIEWKYLRFAKGEEGQWRAAAGTFDEWPKTVKEIRLLDPCMGSGHFLVSAFLVLVRLRMEEEKLSAAEACVAVLRDNLFGLELDTRCTQIAAFNLALAVWKLGGYQTLPPLNLACSGLGMNAREADWLKIAGDNEKLQSGMKRLYQLFRQAPVLGSLINPRALGGDLLVAEFHELQPLLEQALQREKADDAHEVAVTAQGVAKAAKILADQFTLVATNVPYLARGRQDEVLREFCEIHHSDAKTDLSTCFVERCLSFCAADASIAVVTPQSWLLLSGFKKLRKALLYSVKWDFVARLGTGAFETISGEVVNVSLFGFTNTRPSPEHVFAAVDASQAITPAEKKVVLCSQPVEPIIQGGQLKNPDAAVTLSQDGTQSLLRDYADCWQGVVTADDNHFVLRFWEFPSRGHDWEWLQLQPQQTTFCAGRSTLIRWENGEGDLHHCSGAHNFPSQAMLGRPGLAVQRMNQRNVALFDGEIFGDHVAPIIPRESSLIPALWCFLTSPQYKAEVRKFDNTLKAAVGSFIKVPFDLSYWQKVAAEKYPRGLPKPHTDDPTQWLFNGHPKGSDIPLQVAVARLLGYLWPRQTGSSFCDCAALWPDGLEKFADEDGIVCIPSVRGEEPAAERLRKIVRAACGADWKLTSELELIRATSSEAADLDEWLRNEFFEQHCATFHYRPFIWHLWDGRKRDGFHALVNYHTLADGDRGRRTLENLTHSYLGEWITRQKDGVRRGEEGADERLAAALALKEKLEAILEGKPPYDIFVRWKPLSQQAIGWQPAINDGVRMNIRPFATADVFRKRVKIKWEKDRGKEPQREQADFPWFYKNGEFTGERLNDVHLTREQKENARSE